MLSRSVQVESCLGAKVHVTLVTGVAEDVRKMLTLHMVSCASTDLMGKIATNGAVKLLVIRVLFHKLKEFTRVMEIIA